MTAPVHVIGASGRSGLALCANLRADATPFVPIVRNPVRWPGREAACIADLTDAPTLRTTLAGATRIVSCAHARHAATILAAAPPEAAFVFLGSTRKFTQWPDDHANGVLAGEAAFLASGRPGVILHPTMIYGAQGENNVQRLAALLPFLPMVPLPKGGRALVQPIFQEDVTRSIRAALARTWGSPTSIVIAGPEPIPYAAFVRAITGAAGLRPRPVLPVPLSPLLLAARVLGLVPGLPRIGTDELRRLTEHKAFDITDMRRTLGVEPVPLTQGLRAMFVTPRAAPAPHPAAPA